MRRNILPIFLLGLFLIFSAETSAQSFDNLYIFGDSLEDTGNLASLGDPFPFPFFMNRVTNGPVAMDVLAGGLGLSSDPSLHLIGPVSGTNFAVVGARARTSDAIDLSVQVDAFLFNNGGSAPTDALYLVSIGGNDLRDARDEPNEETAEEIVKDAAEMTVMNIRRLVAAGAKSILVLNIPDVGKIPETRLLAAATEDKSLIKKTTKKTKRFNKRLSKRLRKLKKQFDIALIEFDTFAFFDFILKNSAALGFTDTTHACFSSVTFTFHPDCHFGASFDQFIFFDEIHPTAAVHARWGQALLAVIPSPLGSGE